MRPEWSDDKLYYDSTIAPRKEKAIVVIGRCSSNECPDKENEHTHDTVDRGAYRYPFSSMGLVTARTHETPAPEMEETIRCEKVLAIESNPHRYLIKRTGRINNEWEPAAEVPQ
jgi:hypothetical protein